MDHFWEGSTIIIAFSTTSRLLLLLRYDKVNEENDLSKLERSWHKLRNEENFHGYLRQGV